MEHPTLRPAVPADEPFLWAMLFEASHFGESGATSPADLHSVPELAHYVENWGTTGDLGIIGSIDNKPQGAAWLRLLTGNNAGYGYINDTTPELAIATAPEARGTGLGTAMLTRLIHNAHPIHPAISLSVRDTNPARRLYERLGFADVSGSAMINRVGTTSRTMLLRWR
ncbi:GNAT family N-acetyltransferase [Nocardia terpenica]|uniref:GNAT family N-acetyltransferase n=1 Tax=Nocardia terpenica TaxID=455432 RepID=UPI001895D799|nr:N-acetyltransferase [Nocardia terpenica]MBF6065629.1 GNAT family N-acetyltransferase [Nocardia terpenica]MBF6108333.1 GNAT family N-acetyltransferase [Nocardia terpenica]MBF6115744.1 GNAT family N-acetyltransferase [Nocardia terpenica]MBF6122874.1 GNAT family N-acetyltransferase [Nocardia terpenica]MBF6156054.1 GNAT family N-acetyltransferase [Nocardia terpenica]